MEFSTSINIERDKDRNIFYIPTSNSRNVLNHIINDFKSGIHSFNIIGSYGTGKSSFILALESDLQLKSKLLIEYNGQFNDYNKFEFLNIVGDYNLLLECLIDKLNFDRSTTKNFFLSFDEYYQSLQREGKFLIIAIDEFGKILEHAAKNNPEQELYFLQKFAEYVNDPRKNIILLTTLHQGFSAYSNKLTKVQRNEWEKVKGRFKEIVFNEPVEQLLYLAADKIQREAKDIPHIQELTWLYELASESKFIDDRVFPKDLADRLYPLDVFSAKIITLAIQQYGQNERSLFTFLASKDLLDFIYKKNNTYNLAKVYDYIIYNFHSYITDTHQGSANWTAIKVALERVDGNFEDEDIDYASRIVKTIGLLNIFASNGSLLNIEFLIGYSQEALDIPDPDGIIERLKQLKIIRYAKYKSQYILFAGTDVDIEGELLNAGMIVPKSYEFIDKLKQHFDFNIIPAKSYQYKIGTPRYFQFEISDNPINQRPYGEIDGFINLVFSTYIELNDVIKYSENVEEAIIYAYFKNTEDIINQIFEIDKYLYILDRVVIDREDLVARREFEKGLAYEKHILNQIVLNDLFDINDNIVWIFNGTILDIADRTMFNKKLSEICQIIYPRTPVFKNELVNKNKVSGAISTARVSYLQALLEKYDLDDLDFPNDKYPPEKSIYLTLLKNTGIHKLQGQSFILGSPSEDTFQYLWQACEFFLLSSTTKRRNIQELIKTLQDKPFKLKQGFIDFWIPTYLIVKREDYALYSNDMYVPTLNREVLDLLQKNPSDFFVKAFSIEGVKLDLFNKYREAINLKSEDKIEEASFIETIRPFLTFYSRSLNNYARKTNKLQRKSIDFRNVLASATDPEQTFFEDLPKALGFKDVDLVNNTDFLKDFVEILQDSIRELRSCYEELINRIENYILKSLGIKDDDYIGYKKIILERYKDVKEYLLPPKQKAFYSRVVAPLKDRNAWINSISYVIINKSLEDLTDDQEEFLLEKLKYSFAELSNFVDIHKNVKENSNDEILKLDITTIADGTKSTQVIISKDKIKESKILEKQISDLLSEDENINVYALIQILNKKIGK